MVNWNDQVDNLECGKKYGHFRGQESIGTGSHHEATANTICED
jgi:hypothetical protein